MEEKDMLRKTDHSSRLKMVNPRSESTKNKTKQNKTKQNKTKQNKIKTEYTWCDGEYSWCDGA